MRCALILGVVALVGCHSHKTPDTNQDVTGDTVQTTGGVVAAPAPEPAPAPTVIVNEAPAAAPQVNLYVIPPATGEAPAGGAPAQANAQAQPPANAQQAPGVAGFAPPAVQSYVVPVPQYGSMPEQPAPRLPTGSPLNPNGTVGLPQQNTGGYTGITGGAGYTGVGAGDGYTGIGAGGSGFTGYGAGGMPLSVDGGA